MARLTLVILALTATAASALVVSNDELMYAPEEATLEEAALEEAALKDDPQQIDEFTSPSLLLKQLASQPPLRPRLRSISKAAGKPRMVASVVPKLRPLKAKMTHADLEDTVTDLFKIGSMGLTKEQLAATPFGSSVTKIKGLIDDDMMPKVLSAHKMDQDELDKIAKSLTQCGSVKNDQATTAKPSKDTYLLVAPKHLTCRAGEAGLFTEKTSCWEDEADKRKIMNLKCKAFVMVEAKYTNQKNNKVIVSKGGSEAANSYIQRISGTFCGATGGKGVGGFGVGGFLDEFIKAKDDCDKATQEHTAHRKNCLATDIEHKNKRQQCDGLQDQMDGSACKYAVDIKDSCESYAECYTARKAAFDTAEQTVKTNEKDRHGEWKGLKKMACFVNAFTDGKVKSNEIEACRKEDHGIDHLVIKFPKLPGLEVCEVPREYPSTADYKKAQFARLPALAKGKEDANECAGIAEVSTKPATGSPDSCKCERVTMNGPYSPGPVVRCVNCLDVRRSNDKSSCPDGTKLFAPRSRSDWKSFLASAAPLRAPNWIIDVTRPQNGCGGCTKSAMNSRVLGQRSWGTDDGAAWWLRSSTYGEPNGDYHANCFLNLGSFKNEDSITYNDGNCHYHSKSYYCQARQLSLTPKAGSPSGCLCENVALAGSYSAKTLLKCKGCLDVSRSRQKNSCPAGTKLFSPASREDWKTFLASATPLRAPNWIIDVTRPQNGCGGCTGSAMNSKSPAQKTWQTSDGSPWWLRSSRYGEPNGDYHANCYLDLWESPPTENGVTFNDHNCNNHANSYYCQGTKAKRRLSR